MNDTALEILHRYRRQNGRIWLASIAVAEYFRNLDLSSVFADVHDDLPNPPPSD